MGDLPPDEEEVDYVVDDPEAEAEVPHVTGGGVAVPEAGSSLPIAPATPAPAAPAAGPVISSSGPVGQATAQKPVEALKRHRAPIPVYQRAGQRHPDPAAATSPPPIPAVEEAATAAALPAESAVRGVRVGNLVRPFTEGQLRKLLQQSGVIADMWLCPFKRHAVALMDTGEQALAIKDALNGKRWPDINPKRLVIALISGAEAVAEIAAERGPDYVAEVLPEKGSAGARQAAAPGLPVLKACKAASSSLTTPHRDKAGKRSRTREPCLEDFFKRTTAKPAIYFLPLSEEQVAQKKREAAEAAKHPKTTGAATTPAGPPRSLPRQ